jgi:hypothetical protein
MEMYEVVVNRPELISFQLRATSAEDAAARYLTDGEETASKTTELEIVSITRADVEEPAPEETGR